MPRAVEFDLARLTLPLAAGDGRRAVWGSADDLVEVI